MIYKAGTPPVISKTTSGKDGGSTLTLVYSKPSSAAPVGYAVVGDIDAVNTFATKYSRQQTTTPTAGIGSVPQGTQQYAYYFNPPNNSNFALVHKSIELDYNVVSGSTDETLLIEKVLTTLTLN